MTTSDETPATGYWRGLAFTAGMKEHAIPGDAPTSGFPRPSRLHGYKAVYKALCGREVWRSTTQGIYTFRVHSWEPGPRSCKACARLASQPAGTPDETG